jgi:hypothetical protein
MKARNRTEAELIAKAEQDKIEDEKVKKRIANMFAQSNIVNYLFRVLNVDKPKDECIAQGSWESRSERLVW